MIRYRLASVTGLARVACAPPAPESEVGGTDAWSLEAAFDTYFDMVEAGAYDGVAVVGMHAKTGSGGFASHTWTLGIGLAINGQQITETELVGLSWGRVGVPVIFGSAAAAPEGVAAPQKYHGYQ